MSDYSLGIDVGGTKIYSVVLDSENSILGQAKIKTANGEGPEVIAAQVKEVARIAAEVAELSLGDIENIGIAVPSSIDPVTGDCLHAPNLGLKNFSIKKHFRKLFDREVYLGNDGNCGILGEYHHGAAKGFKSAVGYFVGTGLGGGIIIDGKSHVGNGGVAGELGHTIIKYGGVRCNCGNKGCIEAYASKTGFVKALKKKILGKGHCSVMKKYIKPETENLKSKFFARAYRSGDKVTVSGINRAMKMLGAAAASTAATTAPECIVLGGGVMESLGEEIFPVFVKSFKKKLFGIDPSKISLRLSVLEDYAVAFGATVLAIKKGKV
jgi:glucokinase